MKTVVITGASRRLGLHLCTRFLTAGWRVLAVTRVASSELEDLASANAELQVLSVDGYSGSSALALAEQVNATATKLDALIHNASTYATDADRAGDADWFTSLFEIHMAFPAALSEALRPKLASDSAPGNIICITDIYTERPNPEYSLYCASKAGLENLAKSMALRFAPEIRVNTIQPGPLRFLDAHTETAKAAVMAATPMQREGGFEPVATAVFSILENDFMTGSSVRVDGGRSLVMRR